MKTNQSLQDHYNKKYRGKPKEVILVKNTKYPRNRNEASVKWAPKGKSILEIGCGSGQVLKTLENNYSQLIGIEYSKPRYEALLENFKQNSKYKFFLGNIETDNFDITNIDVVIMSDVIEHLIDPIFSMKKIYNMINEGGYVVIATPNIAKWTRRIRLCFGVFPSTASIGEGFTMYNGGPTDILDEGHLHYFTNSMLKKLLIERVGFKKVTFKGYGIPILSSFFPTLFSDCFVVAQK